MKTNRSTIIAAVVFIATAALAQSATDRLLVDEDFDTKWDTSGLGINKWYLSNGTSGWGTSTDTTNDAQMSGRKLAAPSQTNASALRQFAPVTLSSVGDSVTLQFDFRLLNKSVAIAGTLYAGLYNLESTVSAHSSTNLFSGKSGYYLQQNFTSTSAKYMNGANAQVESSAGNFTSANINNFTEHRLTLTLELTAAGLKITSSIDTTDLGSRTDTSVVGSFTVDTLRIYAPNISTNSFLVDNVLVTTNVPAPAVPEPAKATLFLALAALGLLGVRRVLRK